LLSAAGSGGRFRINVRERSAAICLCRVLFSIVASRIRVTRTVVPTGLVGDVVRHRERWFWRKLKPIGQRVGVIVGISQTLAQQLRRVPQPPDATSQNSRDASEPNFNRIECLAGLCLGNVQPQNDSLTASSSRKRVQTRCTTLS